jgi:hypothetical protein
VGVDRRGRAERLEDEQLARGVGQVVLAADDVRDRGVHVVDGDREVVEHAAVRTGDDRIVEVDVGERRVAADDVVHDAFALVGDAQPHRARAAVLAAVAAAGAVLGLEGVDVVLRGVGAVRVALVEQLLQELLVALAARALADRPLVVVEPEPLERLEDLLDVLEGRAHGVGIFDPQHEGPPAASREQPVVERGTRAADVQRAGRRRSKADSHAKPQ